MDQNPQDITDHYRQHLPALYDGWQWQLTATTINARTADGQTKQFPKILVAALRNGEPTKYRGYTITSTPHDTTAPVELAHNIKQRIHADLPPPTPQNLAHWLAKNENLNAIATDETAISFYRAIKQTVTDIEKIINRPEEQRYCGACPAEVSEDGSRCGEGLFVNRDATTVRCWKCRNIYNVEELIQHALASKKELFYTAEEILDRMNAIGEPISDRTWRDWRAKGKLTVRGQLNGEPAYWIDDVLELIAQKPQKSKTGASAHKRAS